MEKYARNRRPRQVGRPYPDVRCGDCGSVMVLRMTERFTYVNTGRPRLFYGCSNYPDCRGIHNAHPDGWPNGYPADKRTREARSLTHKAISAYAQAHRLTMAEMYEFMAVGLEMTDDECHIGKFDLDQCRAALLLCSANEGETHYAQDGLGENPGPDGLGTLGDDDRPWSENSGEPDLETGQH